MSWFEKLLPSRIRTTTESKKGVPEGLWVKCAGCSAILYQPELERHLNVCAKCGHHHPVNIRMRLNDFLDPHSQKEIAADIIARDYLKFRDSKKYKDRLAAAKKKTGEQEALTVVEGRIGGMSIVVAVFNFAFMGGSMGSAVGEKFVRGINRALEKRCPMVCFVSSGGARMQEGMVSLMQMAKTSAAIGRLDQAGLPYICVLTQPTTGGVAASLAMLGDIILAEPNALIGFAGPRVIEQTVGEKLPEGFQSSEFAMQHGHIDMICDRRNMRKTIGKLLAKITHQHVHFDETTE